MKTEISVFNELQSTNLPTPQKSFIIGTHNGVFHSDDVIAVALTCIKTFSFLDINSFIVIRNRDKSELSKCNILIDVGGGEYDHHQIGGNGIRENGIPYASAGLIWNAFGYEILQHFFQEKGLDLTSYFDFINSIKEKIDTEVFQNIDAVDNGILTPKTMFDYITTFLPNWNENNSIDDYNKCFKDVLEITITILEKILSQYVQKAIAFRYIQTEYQNTNSNILKIPNQTFPWLDFILKINDDNVQTIDFVIFEYPSGGWAAQAVPPSKEKRFEKRIPFPKEWAGQTDKLEEISGVFGATFCHNNLFFIRAKTQEAIVAMCYLATQSNKK